MYHKHQTEGIILKGYDSGDSSRKVALFSRELGLVYAHVQNARGLTSKLRGSVQEYGIGKFVLIKGANGWKLVGGEVEHNIYKLLKPERGKLKIVAKVFNLVRSLVGEGDHVRSFYAPLKDFLLSFVELSKEEEKPAEYAILLKMLYELGYLSLIEWQEPLLKHFSFTAEQLKLVSKHERGAVESINYALKAASVQIKI